MNECKPCTKSRQTSAFPHPLQSYARIPKGKNGWEITEKQLKLVKQRKHCFSSASKNFKNQENFSENGRPEIFSKNGRFSAKTEALGSPQFISRTTLVITFHKFYHRHSERFSLRSSKTKSHQHRHIKAFPRLIDVLIWITIRRIPQIPVNTCVHSHVRLYTQKSPCENDHRHLGLERIPYYCPTLLRTKAT